MRKNLLSRTIAMLLVFIMVLSVLPLAHVAAAEYAEPPPQEKYYSAEQTEHTEVPQEQSEYTEAPQYDNEYTEAPQNEHTETSQEQEEYEENQEELNQIQSELATQEEEQNYGEATQHQYELQNITQYFTPEEPQGRRHPGLTAYEALLLDYQNNDVRQ